MYPKKERVLSLLDAALKEMNLLLEMSKDINAPDDFVSSTPGLIVFRAMETLMLKAYSTPLRQISPNFYKSLKQFSMT